jgi:hypothetical protein
VLLIRRIRELLYDQGFTISGARNRLAEGGNSHRNANHVAREAVPEEVDDAGVDIDPTRQAESPAEPALPLPEVVEVDLAQLRIELLSIRQLLAD